MIDVYSIALGNPKWESLGFAEGDNFMNAKRCLRVFGIGLGFLIAIPVASAQSNDAQVQWWQWAFSIPGNINPQLGSYGDAAHPQPVQCVVGQSGSLWFLAGTMGGPAVQRDCTVPQDRQLFFPVMNQIFFNTPKCGQGGQSVSANFERNFVQQQINGATNLSVSLDGKPVAMHFRQSPPFDVALSADNVYNFVFGAPCQSPPDPSPQLQAGVYSPSIDVGYYVQLGQLTTGSHELHFHAEIPANNFVVDVTYHLTVVPVSKN